MEDKCESVEQLFQMQMRGEPRRDHWDLAAWNLGFPWWLRGDLHLIPGLGRSPEEGNGNPLQYSCLENPMEGGTWQATIHGSQRVG